MHRYIVRRFLQSILALLVLSMLVFCMSRLTGDPTLLMLPDDATQEDIAQLRRALGLDRPLPVQYWVFIGNAVQGDFGRSIKGQMPVIDMIKERLPNSIKLAAVALGIAVLLAFPLGVMAAVIQGHSARYLCQHCGGPGAVAAAVLGGDCAHPDLCRAPALAPRCWCR